jgi:hypothetical protein
MGLSRGPKGPRSPNEPFFSDVTNDSIFAKANRVGGIVFLDSTLGVQGCGLKAECQS